MNILKRWSLIIVSLLSCIITPAAFAQLNLYTCDNPVYGIGGSGGYGSYYTSSRCYGTTIGNSNLVTSQAVLRSATNQMFDMITNRIHAVQTQNLATGTSSTMPFGSGFAAGDAMNGVAVWINGAYHHIDNDFSSTEFDGHVAHGMLGMDTLIPDWDALVGIAIGYENQDINTIFNAGSQDADGFSITPYISFFFHPNWSATLLAGYQWLDYDFTRLDPATNQGYVGEADAHRYYFAASLAYSDIWDCWHFTGHAGLRYIREERDAYTESGPFPVFREEFNQSYSRFNLGGSLGYIINNVFEPYIRANLIFDIDNDDILVGFGQAVPSEDDFGAIIGIGAHCFISEDVNLSFDFFKEVARDHYDHHGLSAHLTIKF